MEVGGNLGRKERIKEKEKNEMRRYFGRYLWWRKMKGKKKDIWGKKLVVVEEGRN